MMIIIFVFFFLGWEIIIFFCFDFVLFLWRFVCDVLIVIYELVLCFEFIVLWFISVVLKFVCNLNLVCNKLLYSMVIFLVVIFVYYGSRLVVVLEVRLFLVNVCFLCYVNSFFVCVLLCIVRKFFLDLCYFCYWLDLIEWLIVCLGR